MIVTLIITLLCNLMITVFWVLPQLPATPDAIVQGGQWTLDSISSVIGLLNWVFTPALLAAVVVIWLGLIGFEQAYYLVLWAVKKIPWVNIK